MTEVTGRPIKMGCAIEGVSKKMKKMTRILKETRIPAKKESQTVMTMTRSLNTVSVS